MSPTGIVVGPHVAGADGRVDHALRPNAAPIGDFLSLSGWRLVESRPDQVRGRAGFWLARHRVVARNRRGDQRALSVCVESRRRPRRLPDPSPAVAERLGLDRVAANVADHAVWAYPYDPDLPELADAVSGPVMRERLREAGLIDGPAMLHAQLLRYRPRRRATIRYLIVPRRGRGDRPRAPRPAEALFGKVIRGDRGDRLHALAAGRHRPWSGRWGPGDLRLAVPSPLGLGLFVAPAMPGTSLRSRLVDGGPLPSPPRLARILEAMAAVETPAAGGAGSALPPQPDDRRHPSRLVHHAAGVLADVLPGSRDAVAPIVDAVESGVATGWGPTAFVHGDLYDAQIFVADDYRLGLIDLDDAGPGDPALDAANLCAHLVAMAVALPRVATRLLAYRQLARVALLERLDVPPAEFAWREALALLQLATGPFRVQARGWPAQSRQLIELTLRLIPRPGSESWPTFS